MYDRRECNASELMKALGAWFERRGGLVVALLVVGLSGWGLITMSLRPEPMSQVDYMVEVDRQWSAILESHAFEVLYDLRLSMDYIHYDISRARTEPQWSMLCETYDRLAMYHGELWRAIRDQYPLAWNDTRPRRARVRLAVHGDVVMRRHFSGNVHPEVMCEEYVEGGWVIYPDYVPSSSVYTWPPIGHDPPMDP